MKIKKPLKFAVIAVVFTLSYLTFNFTAKTKKVAGEKINASMFSLGQQAKAYCNEATYCGEVNVGVCIGDPMNPDSYCYVTQSSGQNCLKN
jgi:hypothetical protein